MGSGGSFLQAIHTRALTHTVLAYVGCAEEAAVEILALQMAQDSG